MGFCAALPLAQQLFLAAPASCLLSSVPSFKINKIAAKSLEMENKNKIPAEVLARERCLYTAAMVLNSGQLVFQLSSIYV